MGLLLAGGATDEPNSAVRGEGGGVGGRAKQYTIILSSLQIYESLPSFIFLALTVWKYDMTKL